MTALKGHRMRACLIGCLALYAAGVAGYTVWSAHETREAIMGRIDRELLLVAQAVPHMLAPDFHDRAVDAGAITRGEELANRESVSRFAGEAGFKYAYTLAWKDGSFFFTAPTVTAQEAKERESWYFYPYEDAPAEFRLALERNQATFVTYSDQWGTFRSVAMPLRSPGGRSYLSCADCDIGHIRAMMRASYARSTLTAIGFLALSFPFVLMFSRVHRAHMAALTAINEELVSARDGLEVKVRERTEELACANAALSESQKSLQSLFDAAPIGMILVDDDLRVSTMNEHAAGLARRSIDDLVGFPFGAGLGCPDAQSEPMACGRHRQCPACLSRRCIARVVAGELERASDEVEVAPGRWLGLQVASVVVGDRRHALVAVDDVSDRRRAETAMRGAKEDAEQASRTQGEFLANLSVEIRSPLKAIIGLSERIAANTRPEEARNVAGTIKTESEALLNRISRLLDHAGIEAGGVEPSPGRASGATRNSRPLGTI
jgi:PAS domain-containing protein